MCPKCQRNSIKLIRICIEAERLYKMQNKASQFLSIKFITLKKNLFCRECVFVVLELGKWGGKNIAQAVIILVEGRDFLS